MYPLTVRVAYDVLRLLSRVLLSVGFQLQIQGREHVPRRGAFILASNHLSYLDPAVVGAACPRRLVFLARADLFSLPVLGPFLRAIRAIPLDPQKSEAGLREAIRLLRAGQPVAIFPEGGRQFSGTLGRARPGVGWLAASANVPIIPLLLDGTFQALPPGARMVRPTKIRVAFGSQIMYPDAPVSDEIFTALAEQVTASWRRLKEHGHSPWKRPTPHP